MTEASARSDAASSVRRLQNLPTKLLGERPVRLWRMRPGRTRRSSPLSLTTHSPSRLVPSILMECREIAPVTARRPSDRHARKPCAARARAAAVPRLLSCPLIGRCSHRRLSILRDSLLKRFAQRSLQESSGAPCTLPRSATGCLFGCTRQRANPSRRISPSDSRGSVTGNPAWSGVTGHRQDNVRPVVPGLHQSSSAEAELRCSNNGRRHDGPAASNVLHVAASCDALPSSLRSFSAAHAATSLSLRSRIADIEGAVASTSRA